MTTTLNVWPFAVGASELVCAHQIRVMQPRERQYLATGLDPRFRLKRPLPTGWYMLEVLLDLPVAACVGTLYFDTGGGESEEQSYRMPVRSGRMAKRLVHLSARSSLRFDPCQREGEFALKHFRLVRMTRQAALQRLRSKLGDQNAGSPSAEPSQSELWKSYNRLFIERTTNQGLLYADWIAQVEQPALLAADRQRELIARWAWRPTFSILLPTFNTHPDHLRECLGSVLAQTYADWQLCVADDASTLPHVRQILREFAAADSRVRTALRQSNGHIVAASNSALALATRDFVVLLDHDDMLAPHALFAVAQALQQRPDAQLIYSDEDKIDLAGERCDPYFKPDFARDLLYSQNYISHLGVFRRDLVERLGGFRQGTQGSQDYDLVLRCVASIDNPQNVLHVPQVLYHWRKTPTSTSAGHDNKDYATEAARRALQDHFDDANPGVQVQVVEPGLYRPHWPLPQPEPLVTLIVPTRDGYQVLEPCIESILNKTAYRSFEILVIDNQSTCPRTLRYLSSLQSRDNVRVLHYDHPFNFSAINNLGAREANGTLLGLINNDVEVINPDWLGEMVRHAVRPDIGCVGAKLYYTDGTLQHAGVVLGIGGVAGHSHKYLPGDSSGYFSRLRIVHNVSAVTGAVLLVRKRVFEAVGGLDEAHLTVAFNDVDLCLKCMAAGYRNLWTPFAELHHHESKTRGPDSSPQQQARFKAECAVMIKRWASLLRDDPYYNPNLSLLREDYSLAAVRRRRQD